VRSAVDFVKALVASIRAADTFNVAYQVAYCALFAVFPFAIFLLTLIAYVPLHGLDQELLSAVYRLMPGPAARLCDQVLHEIVARQRGWLLVIALAGAVWSASGGVKALLSALNRAYGVSETRPWWRVTLTALLMTLGAGIAVVVAAAGLLIGPEIVRRTWAWFGFGGAFDLVWRYIRWPMVAAAIVMMLGGLYLFLPNVKLRGRTILPGALVAVLLWVGVSHGFNLYVSHFGSYAKTYGALGTVIVMLTWFYLSSAAIILGGQVNAVLDRMRQERRARVALPERPATLQPA
jgi:membrane protein